MESSLSEHVTSQRHVTSRNRLKCVLMEPGDVIRIDMAAFRAKRNAKTIRRWVQIYGIGRQVGPSAPLEISLPALEMVLHGDFDALEMLRAGQRQHPDVIRYFEHVGMRP